jgi:thioredoxin 1
MLFARSVRRSLSSLRVVSSDAEFTAIQGEGKKVVAYFTAVWCGPCQQIAPFVEKMADDNADDVIVAKIDIDALQETAVKSGVKAVPTFLFLDADGSESSKIVGADSSALSTAMDTLLDA